MFTSDELHRTQDNKVLKLTLNRADFSRKHPKLGLGVGLTMSSLIPTKEGQPPEERSIDLGVIP